MAALATGGTAVPGMRPAHDFIATLFARPTTASIVGVWMFLNSIALLFSVPAFFAQPAFRLVAASGLNVDFWGMLLMGMTILIFISHVMTKPFLSATVMVVTAAFLIFYGATLAITGLTYGLVSVNGWWCCYLGIRCAVNATCKRPVI